MNLQTQKKLAAEVGKCSPKRVHFAVDKLEEIKESITKSDIKKLISNKIIRIFPKRGVSRARANKARIQKRKGKRKGHGSRKGKQNARNNSKIEWMNRVRLQRLLLKVLRDNGSIAKKDYQTLYMKVKGGYFRSKNHLKLYISEHNLVVKK